MFTHYYIFNLDSFLNSIGHVALVCMRAGYPLLLYIKSGSIT